ncbi:Ankyrin repeat protein 2 [Giardia muris]|uniref:Ankyrin repeat protein 2 n=1 Tax=Giardia muris TaxID=5742 RepID=A0A4Z1SQ82_GIAMU|nr:Ankyrin repeat protein 2 [Giardia muris]|eukprot:TNJ27966.1 Ankyrin repeat protein 2 [Giardia muris]
MSVTALMYAAMDGNLRAVKANLNKIKKRSSGGETALMKTAHNGHASCIPFFKRELGIQDRNGWTALMWATYDGRVDCIRLLLSEAGKQTTKEWYDFPPGTTALMIAAHRNYHEIVELLLPYEQGMTDSKGHTAKWYAYNSPRRGDFTRVRQLLENEGTERIPPPSPGLTSQEHINKLTAESEFLRKEIALSKNAYNEVEKKLARLNQEVFTLKQQIEKYQNMNKSRQKASDRKAEQAKAMITCIICLMNQRNILLLPCNHLCVCSSCMRQLENQKCPLCNGSIKGVARVYF